MYHCKRLLHTGVVRRNPRCSSILHHRNKDGCNLLGQYYHTVSSRDDDYRWLGGILAVSAVSLLNHMNDKTKSEERKVNDTKIDIHDNDDAFDDHMKKKKDNDDPFIEIDLLDKLASKPYVHYHNTSFKEEDDATTMPRPKGIPKRIRILVVDVPEFRDLFTDGECRVNTSRVFVDDIAPAKKLKGGVEISQKTLATALVRCRKNERIGVELLEASVMDMNPLNLRRIYTFGGYQYDPGKYSASAKTKTKTKEETKQVKEQEEEKEKEKEKEKEEKEKVDSEETKKNNKEDKHGTPDRKVKKNSKVKEEQEMEAPWNQYAWIEEMQLRINGLIPFGAAVEPASFFSRMILGHAYKRTVHSSRSYISYVIPSFLLPASYSNPDGIDGDYRYSPSKRNDSQSSSSTLRKVKWNRASCKPHAVIVNGAAMQRIPGSLRFLTNCCREANIPLFVVNDPRVWGQNTHVSLHEAARDIRKVIKRNMLQNALSIKEGNMFERGRKVGRFEADTKWKAYDVSRKTRQAVQDAHNKWKLSQKVDWSKLDSKELLKRLIEHKVITPIVNTGSTKLDDEMDQYMYTEALIQLCDHILQKNQTGINMEETSPEQIFETDPTEESAPKEEQK